MTPSKDRASEASALVQVSTAISGLAAALAPHGLAVDAVALCLRFGVPTTTAPKPEPIELPAAQASESRREPLRVAA